jgi:para-nitrobenzyl esterase
MGDGSGPQVAVAGGMVEGRTVEGVSSFLGIPYAAAPFGANRMRPPQPAHAWDGVRAATGYGPTVPKGDYPPQYQPLFPEVVIPGEECLNLNVWTPNPTGEGARLPVLVWIHGGSFMNGSGSVSQYDGTAFARDGVVCVTINYRLAAEGFLYLGDDVANLGLLDQLAALEWVRDNIAAFGGDPARVTVAGESAGAMSITTLLGMPRSAGLFGQAIVQSGAAAHTLTAEQGRLVGGYLADALGVDADRASIGQVPLDTLVRTASDLVVEVQTAPDPAKWGPLAMSLLPFAPVIDGDVLPTHPLAAISDGRSSDVRLLIGSNREESRLFLVAPGVIDLIDEPTLQGAAAAYGLSPEGLEVYRANRPDASPGDLMAAIVTDWFFAVPGIRVAEAHASAAPEGSTWCYRCDHLTPADNHGLGAAHATEIPFVFDTADLPDSAALVGEHPSRATVEALHSAWVSFVKGGSPGWAPYTVASRTTGVFTDRLTEVDDPSGDERALWDAIR